MQLRFPSGLSPSARAETPALAKHNTNISGSPQRVPDTHPAPNPPCLPPELLAVACCQEVPTGDAPVSMRAPRPQGPRAASLHNAGVMLSSLQKQERVPPDILGTTLSCGPQSMLQNLTNPFIERIQSLAKHRRPAMCLAPDLLPAPPASPPKTTVLGDYSKDLRRSWPPSSKNRP